MNHNTSKLLLLWLKNANCVFDESYFRQQFLSHPDAPGVTAITDSLNDVSIANMAVEIPFEELHKIEFAFMAYIKQEREEQFALVQKKSNNTWELKMRADSQIIISSQKFKQLFTGIVVLIEPAPAAKFNRIRKLIQARYVIPALIIPGFLITFIGNVAPAFHFLFSVSGLLISMLIVAKELGLNTTGLEKFCNLNATTNCDAVLNSRYSAIMGKIKLSDVSLVFFAFQIFAWLFYFPLQPSVANYLYAASIIVLPVTLVSIFLQRFILKKWCPLCLLICGVLWVHAIVSAIMFLNGTNIQFSLPISVTLLTATMMIWLGWQLIRDLLQKTGKNEELTIRLMSFKRNYRLFMPLHRQLPELETSISGINDIVLGERDAPLNMIVVSNPLCSTCIALHHQLHQWVTKYPELSVSIRFYVPTENKNDSRTLIAAKLVELYMNNAETGLAEIDAWYKNPDIEIFYQRNSKMHNADALRVLKLHRQWCMEQNIVITPTILINKKRFPLFYDPEDVGFFIGELIHTAKTRVNHTPPEEALNLVLS